MVEDEHASNNQEMIRKNADLQRWLTGLVTQLIKNEEGKVGPTLGLIIGLFILLVGSGLVEMSFLTDNKLDRTGVITAVPTNPPVYQETYPAATTAISPEGKELNPFLALLNDVLDDKLPEICFYCSEMPYLPPNPPIIYAAPTVAFSPESLTTYNDSTPQAVPTASSAQEVIVEKPIVYEIVIIYYDESGGTIQENVLMQNVSLEDLESLLKSYTSTTAGDPRSHSVFYRLIQ